MLTLGSHAQGLLQIEETTRVGESSLPHAIQMVLRQGGVVDRVKVVTHGSEGGAFSLVDEKCVSTSAYFPQQSCAVSIRFKPFAPGLQSGAVLLLDRSGKALAARPLAATALGAIATFVPGQITSVAGNSSFLYGGDGGIATQTSLFLPFGITLDGASNLYIADTYNNRIRKVNAATRVISTVAGNGNLGASGDGGSALNARLNNPSSVQLDSAGNIYIADTGNNAIRFVNGSTGVISTVAGVPGSQGYAGDSGPAVLATLQSPNGIALDVAGNLYIADTGNNVIRFVDASTGIISTFAGNGKAAYAGDGRAAKMASLSGPWGVTLSNSGELYIADQKNNVVRKVNAEGIISTVAGLGLAGYSGDGASATGARLNTPASVAIDAAGNIYISDSGNNRIRKINPATNDISTIAGDNTTSLQPDGFPANQAALYGPYTLALDGLGSIYVADVFHNRIREIPSNVAILIYPAMRINAVSPPLRQVLENDGNAPLEILQINPVSNAQIDPSTTCSGSAPLAPLAQCTIAADFAPTEVRKPAHGSIVIDTNALNANNTLLLQGDVQSTSPSTVLVSSSPNPSIFGNPVVFSIQVVSSGVIPTGSVNLLDGSTTIATLQLTNGVASTTISDLAVGQHTITASYGGDVNTAAGVSLPVLQVVTILPPDSNTVTSLTSSANPLMVGQTLNLTVTVSAVAAGQVVPAGTVNVMEGNTLVGTGTLSAGSAIISTASLTPGTHLLTAVYSGSSQYSTSTSSVLTQLVVAANPMTTTSLTASADPITVGSTLTLYASVSAVAGGQTIPGGTVSFMDGTTLIGTGTLSAGAASYSTTSLRIGTHLITAVYSGDTNYTASTSAVLDEFVVSPGSGQPAQFTLAITPATLSLQRGTHRTLQVSITTVDAFADVLSLGCGGLPSAATCTFSKNQVSVTGGTTTTVTLILDTGDPLGSGASALLQRSSTSGTKNMWAGLLPLGVLLTLLFGRRHRSRYRVLATLIFGALGLALLSGCGSSVSSTSTPSGNFTFQVFATGSATGASYVVPVHLTVTK